MRLSKAHALTLCAVASAEAYTHLAPSPSRETTRPRAAQAQAESYDKGNPFRINATTVRDAECKSCPFKNCLNSDVILSRTNEQYQCYTNGDSIGGQKTWLRHQFGQRQDEFCYVPAFDVQARRPWDIAELPYCGTKSELEHYLPTTQVKTAYYTECSICPYRDCTGIKFYPSGSSLNVNCQVGDGWLQMGPRHPEGSTKYYRTADDCYVSLQNVETAPTRPDYVEGNPNPVGVEEVLPPCGPVPYLRAEDRPNMIDGTFSWNSVASRTVSSGGAPRGSTLTSLNGWNRTVTVVTGAKVQGPKQQEAKTPSTTSATPAIPRPRWNRFGWFSWASFRSGYRSQRGSSRWGRKTRGRIQSRGALLDDVIR